MKFLVLAALAFTSVNAFAEQVCFKNDAHLITMPRLTRVHLADHPERFTPGAIYIGQSFCIDYNPAAGESVEVEVWHQRIFQNDIKSCSDHRVWSGNFIEVTNGDLGRHWCHTATSW